MENSLKFKLYYFDTRGRAEPIRLMLHYCRQEFEDVRFSVSDWDTLKVSMPQETVPILEVNGKKLPQSRAIMRYLGRLFDLTGRNHLERAVADSIVDLLADFYTQILPWYSIRHLTESDPENLLKLKNERLIPAVESKVPYFVDYLKEAKSGYYVKSGITFVDFLCCELFSIVQDFEPEVLLPYPEITDHIKRIYSLPQLKEYITNRK
ncbi:hypothetical protein FO519_006218 [Halicephalobus sp. NKZ332]|nr:hypothetical protein FO519_006218 [Halicephalobus sp. NKZ332]